MVRLRAFVHWLLLDRMTTADSARVIILRTLWVTCVCLVSVVTRALLVLWVITEVPCLCTVASAVPCVCRYNVTTTTSSMSTLTYSVSMFALCSTPTL